MLATVAWRRRALASSGSSGARGVLAVTPPARARGGGSGGVALPGWVTGLVDAPPTRMALRVLGLAAGVGVLVLAALGPADADRNPASRLVLVVGWAGLVPLSLVAPGAWRALSPLRGVSSLLARLSGDPGERSARALPDGLGWWPGVAALAAVIVVEGPLRGDPTALLVFLVTYSLLQVGCAALYGSGWYAHAEAFEVVAALVGRLSPVARGPDGRWALSNPLPRIAAPLPAGATTVVGLLVGAALADFTADTSLWRRVTLGRAGSAETGLDLALLLACVVAATLLLRAAGPPALRPAVVPMATGYLVAHYFAVLLIEGQAAVAQLGNLRAGALDIVVNYDLLPGPLAAGAQLLGFLIPHLLAALVGVDLAATRYGRRAGAAAAPLVGVLVLSAVAGTALRYSAA